MRNLLKKTPIWIKYLIFGDETQFHSQKVNSAIKVQIKNIKNIWSGKKYKSFGIERIIRLFLSLFQFVSIGLYVRWFFGRFGLLWRKVGVELFVVFKVFLPVLILITGLTPFFFIPYLFAYLLLDTLFYIAGLIFLTDIYRGTIGYKRSLITLFLNYIEITFDFAVIYFHYNLICENFFNRKMNNAFEAVYFSFITSATVGYGDIAPLNPLGQLLVVFQVIIFFIFIGIFLNYFTSKMNTETYFNRKSSRKTN